jgi:hypothetical protein
MTPAGTDLEAAEKLWLKVQEQSMVSAQARIIDGGKQVITLSTALAGAYFTALAFSSLATVASVLVRIAIVLPVLCWTVAIIAAMRTVIPVKEYETSIGDALSGKMLFVESVLDKVKWLNVGLWLQLLGIVMMLVVLWLRLSGVAALPAPK